MSFFDSEQMSDDDNFDYGRNTFDDDEEVSDNFDYYNDFEDEEENDDFDEYGENKFDENIYQTSYKDIDRVSSEDNSIFSKCGIQRLEGKFKKLRTEKDNLVIDMFNIFEHISRHHTQVFGEYKKERNDYLEKILKPFCDDNTDPSSSQKLLSVHPLAFILGYVASNGGTQITQTSFQNAIKMITNVGKTQIGISKVNEVNITTKPQVDEISIMRYARFWIHYVSKL